MCLEDLANDWATGQDSWGFATDLKEAVQAASEASATNSATLETVATAVESTTEKLGEAAATMTEASTTLGENAAEVRQYFDDYAAKLEEYWASDEYARDHERTDDSSAGDSGGGGDLGASVKSGLSSFFDWVGSYFTTASTTIAEAEAATTTASAVVTQLEQTVDASAAALVPPVEVANQPVGRPIPEVIEELENIKATFADIPPESQQLEDVRAARARLEESIAQLKKFQADADALTAPFEKPMLGEWMTYVSTAADGILAAQHVIDQTKLKNFIPTEQLAQTVRAKADEIIAECQQRIDHEVDTATQEKWTGMYDRIVTSPDGMDAGDYETGAGIVQRTKALVVDGLADAMVEGLAGIGNLDVTDALSFGVARFGTPAVKAAMETIEFSSEVADTVIGAGVTVAELYQRMRDNPESVDREAIDSLVDVATASGELFKDALKDALKDVGAEHRERVLQQISAASQQMAETAEANRLEILRAREATRTAWVQERGTELTTAAEELKQEANRVLLNRLTPVEYSEVD